MFHVTLMMSICGTAALSTHSVLMTSNQSDSVVGGALFETTYGLQIQ